MRSLVNWKDMVCEFPNRFAQTVEGDKVTLQRSPGTVRTGSYADVFRSNENVAETE